MRLSYVGVGVIAINEAWKAGLPDIDDRRRDGITRGKERGGEQRVEMGCGLCLCLGGIDKKA